MNAQTLTADYADALALYDAAPAKCVRDDVAALMDALAEQLAGLVGWAEAEDRIHALHMAA